MSYIGAAQRFGKYLEGRCGTRHEERHGLATRWSSSRRRITKTGHPSPSRPALAPMRRLRDSPAAVPRNSTPSGTSTKASSIPIPLPPARRVSAPRSTPPDAELRGCSDYPGCRTGCPPSGSGHSVKPPCSRQPRFLIEGVRQRVSGTRGPDLRHGWPEPRRSGNRHINHTVLEQVRALYLNA